MRRRMAGPYAGRSFEELAGNAAALAAFNPDPERWREWPELAQQAERAARAHDELQTLHACTHCHRTYRREYVERFRNRRLPAEH